MNHAFSEQILADELSKLNYTRSRIQSLSCWCIFHRKNAEQVVQTWAKQFRSSRKEKKIPYLYLANDILQNGRRTGPEFVDRFWKVLPAALMDVFKNGGEHGKNIISRLANIWVERRVFGSRGQDLKDFILGNEPSPALELNKNYSCSSAGIVRRDSQTKLSVGGKEEKILSAFCIVISEKPKEDVDMNKCMNAVRHVWELEKKIKYACRRVHGISQPWKETLANELQKHEITLTKCLEKLISVEANRAALVSQLKAALEEQESTLENVRTQIQVAQGTLEEAEDMQRQVHDEPVVMSAKLPPSAEPPKPNSNYPALQPQNKGTAAIAAEVANKFAASTRSLKIKTSVLSAFVAEEAESAYLVRSAGSINSFSEPPAKKMKFENPMPVSNPSATATAFMPVPQMAISAPHPPQTVLVQQTPIQNQTMSFQPQFNLYQSSTMQYLQPSEGVMTGLLDSYKALPPLPPPPPPPQMMNLTMPVFLTHQQQQPVALFQQLPPPPPPAPPPSMPMYQPLPINQQPTNQPVSINQQPAQSSIRKPMAPSYRPLLPPRMAFYNPQTQ